MKNQTKKSQEPSKDQNSHPELQDPPYPERLNQEKPFTQPEFDFLGELKNVCVKIPLFQEIKDVPIYSKAVRELCLRKPSRKQKDPQTVHVMGKLSDLMMGGVLTAKYSDPGSPVVNV
jgi:hypothetical protein